MKTLDILYINTVIYSHLHCTPLYCWGGAGGPIRNVSFLANKKVITNNHIIFITALLIAARLNGMGNEEHSKPSRTLAD